MMSKHRSLVVATLASLAVLVGSLTPRATAQVEQPASFHHPQSPSTEPRSLERIGSRSEFDRMARVYDRGRFGSLPHLMFVIDRSNGRTHYVNSKLYRFHKDFVNATYLSLERGLTFYENNYLKNDRRFLLGTVAHRLDEDKFTFEFWEGDKLTAALLDESYSTLSRTFFGRLLFKPNSDGQIEIAREVNRERDRVPTLAIGQRERDRSYQPLNLGAAIGQLRIIDRLEAETIIDRNQIVIFKQVPLRLTPISGIITTEPASPLSHVNLLAKSWGVPNAYIKDADQLFKNLEGKYVRLELRDAEYSLKPADVREVEERSREWLKRADLGTPKADLEFSRLADLKDQRAMDALRFGAKSANLGEIMETRISGIVVPPGFTIPFHYYVEFLRRNDLEQKIADAVEEDRFVHDPRFRKQQLAAIRRWIVEGRHDARFQRAVVNKVRLEYRGKGLFVRSSTNAEDLPNFSGAGLYTTVPNVRTTEQLMLAIKTVWASIWNYEAFEARESFGMNHFGVYPAVLIQEGIDADSAGVAITTDPFDKANTGSVYINAKRGLGIRVVEGRRVAEQLLYSTQTGDIRVLTRSADDTMLSFDRRGGVKEVKTDLSRMVLTDDLVKRLSSAAVAIKGLFGERNQDIEWLFKDNQLFIVQSRPYIEAN